MRSMRRLLLDRKHRRLEHSDALLVRHRATSQTIHRSELTRERISRELFGRPGHVRRLRRPNDTASDRLGAALRSIPDLHALRLVLLHG